MDAKLTELTAVCPRPSLPSVVYNGHGECLDHFAKTSPFTFISTINHKIKESRSVEYRNLESILSVLERKLNIGQNMSQ